MAATFLFQILEDPLPLLIITALMVIANVGYRLHAKSLRADQLKRIQNHSLAQIVLDLFSLILLLHFAGGVENPLAFYFVFHMIIAGLLLPKRESYLIAVIAAILYGAMAFLEYSGVLRHYHLKIFPHQRSDLLDLMEEALDRIALITRRLLLLSRSLELKPQPVQVNEVVERALALL